MVSPSPTRSDSYEPTTPSVLLDPAVLRAARQIYRTYYEIHPQKMQNPVGVVIDRHSHRGKLVFGNKPILLYTESFVPFNQLEAPMY